MKPLDCFRFCHSDYWRTSTDLSLTVRPQGTGGQTSVQTVHLSPPDVCLILSFCFFLSIPHVQFCKAKSRCTLSQVVHQQHSVTVSYHSLLQYSPPLLSFPLFFHSSLIVFSLFLPLLASSHPLLILSSSFSPLDVKIQLQSVMSSLLLKWNILWFSLKK